MTRDEQECRQQLAELKEENSQLRQSAEQFGLLAERLNRQLGEERRRGAERRATARGTLDRRQPRNE
ncbi:MAG TPA: hypothetical protein VGI12_15895 [Vicinamibacterales bacterium]|jgi:hypothetical protein